MAGSSPRSLMPLLLTLALTFFHTAGGDASAPSSKAYWNLQRKDSKRVLVDVEYADDMPELGIDDEISLSGAPGSKWRVEGEVGRARVEDLREGSRVQMKEALPAVLNPKMVYQKGMVGTVLEVDADGDARLKFDHLPAEDWVKHHDFDKLAVIGAGKERKAWTFVLVSASECPHALGALTARRGNGTWEPWGGMYEFKRGYIPKGNQVHEASFTMQESQEWCSTSAACSGFCFQLTGEDGKLVHLKSKPSWWSLDAQDPHFASIKQRTDFKNDTRVVPQDPNDEREGFWWSAHKVEDPRAFCVRHSTAGKCPESPFACLGVSTDASEATIKQAYRKKAMQYHPDKLGNKVSKDTLKQAEEQFRTISDAHETLLDPRKKHQAMHRQRMLEQQDKNRAKQEADFYPDHLAITAIEPITYRQFLGLARAWVIHFYDPALESSRSAKSAFSVAANVLSAEGARDVFYGAVNCRRYRSFCEKKTVASGEDRIVLLAPSSNRRELYSGKHTSSAVVAWFREVTRPESSVVDVSTWPLPSPQCVWLLYVYGPTKSKSSCAICGSKGLPILRRGVAPFATFGVKVGVVNCTKDAPLCKGETGPPGLFDVDSEHQFAVRLVTPGPEHSLVDLINPQIIPKPWSREQFVLAISSASNLAQSLASAGLTGCQGGGGSSSATAKDEL